MKLYFSFHEVSELQTTMTLEESEACLVNAIGSGFTGTQKDDGFQLSHKDVNPFRPEIAVQLRLGDEGVLAVADMKLHPALLVFLCIWSVVVIALAVWRNWLLLVMLPVFWMIAVIAFSVGVDAAKKALTETLDAVEIIG